MTCDKFNVDSYAGPIFVRVLVCPYNYCFPSLSLSPHTLTDATSETSEVASTELPPLAESQSKELEKVYTNGQYQDAAVLRELAHRLELTDSQIQVRHSHETSNQHLHNNNYYRTSIVTNIVILTVVYI